MVISLHCNKDILWVYEFHMQHINRIFINIVEALSIVAVNIFVLITGYFSISSKKIQWKKIFDLAILSSFYGGGYLLSIIIGHSDLTLKDLVLCVFPYLSGKDWFISMYIVLIILGPYINKVIDSLTINNYRFLVLILVILFSVWPTISPYAPIDDQGYEEKTVTESSHNPTGVKTILSVRAQRQHLFVLDKMILTLINILFSARSTSTTPPIVRCSLSFLINSIQQICYKIVANRQLSFLFVLTL